MNLRGKVALVTGGAKRVGRSIALELAGAGANLVIHCNRSRAEAEAAAAAARAAGVEAAVVAGDLADPGTTERVAAEARAAFGSVDVLVNNASVFVRTPIDELADTVWEQTLAVNLRAPFLLGVRLGLAMQEVGEGCIVNLGDWAGVRPYRGYLPYCVSKAGMVALTRGLARALAPQVRVHCVAPGPVLPPEDYTPAERAHLAALAPLRRLGSPEAVARMVRFLITEADYSTGGVYLADGGRLYAAGAGDGGGEEP